jgi:pimeloyl-ACP methyl ester carboxylesterase
VVAVLLHGVGSNAESFLPLMKTLPASLDVIAWNAPGYGQSKCLEDEFPTPPDYAAALVDLLDTLGAQCVVLVGHSIGALFAGSFAAGHPERVSALALLSPALGYRIAPGERLPAAVQSRIDEVTTLGPAAFAAKRSLRLVGNPAAYPDVVAAVERAMAAIHPKGYAQAVWALGSGDLIRDLKKINAPTIIAVGDLDVVTPPDKVASARGHLRDLVGYRLVAGAGHALPQEQPGTIADCLIQLIAVLPKNASVAVDRPDLK